MARYYPRSRRTHGSFGNNLTAQVADATGIKIAASQELLISDARTTATAKLRRTARWLLPAALGLLRMIAHSRDGYGARLAYLSTDRQQGRIEQVRADDRGHATLGAFITGYLPIQALVLVLAFLAVTDPLVMHSALVQVLDIPTRVPVLAGMFNPRFGLAMTTANIVSALYAVFCLAGVLLAGQALGILGGEFRPRRKAFLADHPAWAARLDKVPVRITALRLLAGCAAVGVQCVAAVYLTDERFELSSLGAADISTSMVGLVKTILIAMPILAVILESLKADPVLHHRRDLGRWRAHWAWLRRLDLCRDGVRRIRRRRDRLVSRLARFRQSLREIAHSMHDEWTYEGGIQNGMVPVVDVRSRYTAAGEPITRRSTVATLGPDDLSTVFIDAGPLDLPLIEAALSTAAKAIAAADQAVGDRPLNTLWTAFQQGKPLPGWPGDSEKTNQNDRDQNDPDAQSHPAQDAEQDIPEPEQPDQDDQPASGREVGASALSSPNQFSGVADNNVDITTAEHRNNRQLADEQKLPAKILKERA